MNPRERDEFERIRRLEQVDRDRAIIAQHEEGMVFYRASRLTPTASVAL